MSGQNRGNDRTVQVTDSEEPGKETHKPSRPVQPFIICAALRDRPAKGYHRPVVRPRQAETRCDHRRGSEKTLLRDLPEKVFQTSTGILSASKT